MSRPFHPIASSSKDGEDITLMRILESVSATAYNYTLSNYATADKPGTIVISDAAGNTISTLTLSYDGSNNLTSVVRS